MGVAAGHYIAAQLKAKGVTEPDHRRDPGHRQPAADPGPQQGLRATRSAQSGFKVEQPGRGRVHRRVRPGGHGQPAAGAPKIDAIWNHDDDQGVGVLAAIDAGRPQRVLHGRRRRLARTPWSDIKADNTVLKATVTYPPTMASSAIKLARLIAQGKGMSDLVELQVPSSITLASETITKENVDQYLPLGFES